MAWYWVVLIGCVMFYIGFTIAAILASSKRSDEIAEQAWNKHKMTLMVLILAFGSACTTVNCPSEAEEYLRAWATVEVLPAGKGTHTIDVVILQLVIDESELLSEGDTVAVAQALDLLQFQQADVVIAYRDRWELEAILEE